MLLYTQLQSVIVSEINNKIRGENNLKRKVQSKSGIFEVGYEQN